jgi:hypothetical protein
MCRLCLHGYSQPKRRSDRGELPRAATVSAHRRSPRVCVWGLVSSSWGGFLQSEASVREFAQLSCLLNPKFPAEVV